ncbi:unnamed protein product [Miscanthus lutarioriparius]|uniref:Uncharacterized protein n=1 Tax=Miscanthus lutarioriparius TaxID=422564 RepID=A0A811N517_9POAL|nr:unnamed protein product [Miscanthus lutarioriparius]
MPIDLNTLSDPHGEVLLDLNEQPPYEQEDEIMSLQQDQLYEDEAHLQDQHGHLLPDLNENPVYEQEDEIARLQEDQLYEDEAHLQGMMEDMHDYGVYAHAVDIVFDEEELEGSMSKKITMQMKTMHISLEI